jgi:hypothetical protein
MMRSGKPENRLPTLSAPLGNPFGIPNSHRFDDGIDIPQQFQKQQIA